MANDKYRIDMMTEALAYTPDEDPSVLDNAAWHALYDWMRVTGPWTRGFDIFTHANISIQMLGAEVLDASETFGPTRAAQKAAAEAEHEAWAERMIRPFVARLAERQAWLDDVVGSGPAGGGW